jgi:hypothetical protein
MSDQLLQALNNHTSVNHTSLLHLRVWKSRAPSVMSPVCSNLRTQKKKVQDLHLHTICSGWSCKRALLERSQKDQASFCEEFVRLIF